MPEIGKTSNEFYIASYQKTDGSNTTMAIRSVNYQAAENLTFTGGVGGSTNFNGNNSLMLEGKAKYNVNDHFSVQARLRNSLSSKQNSTQFRLTTGYKTNVSDNTSIYVNPYVSAKYDCSTGKLTTDKGVFAGVSQKLHPMVTLSGEVQKYNGLEGGAENWGINAILSYNF